jgi:HPt (histidine-containing phosphotransfer) domain-containing protein
MKNFAGGEENGAIQVRVDADLEELMPRFMENRGEDIRSIKSALAVGDFETIATLAHGLKGSGGGYGFDEITRIGIALERAAQARSGADIQKSLDHLGLYLAQVEIIYE